jgi:4-amino-4-deoxy-L-arabinose transferase-like glycosyltransferase
MGHEETRGRRWERRGLAAIVLASTGLALGWVFLVPIFQAPDEPQHLDYALAINAHRGLFKIRGDKKYADFPPVVHPFTWYLIARAETNRVAFHPEQRVTPDYGTWAYYRAIDRDAPPWNSGPADTPSPLITVYPFGYYAVLAVWIEGLRLVRDKPVFLFFGARIFSVLLLAVTLVLVHAAARLLHFKPWQALMLTACVGLFPMTTFVSSYVQPDNLAFTLVCLAYYLVLRLRDEPGNWRLLGGLGLGLGLLFVTKTHFFVCVAAPVFAMLAAEMYQRRLAWWRVLGAAVILAAPCAAAAAIHLWTVWGTPNHYGTPAKHLGSVLHTIRWFHNAVLHYYAFLTHISFWGMFGWADTPLVIGRPRTNEVVQYATLAVGWVTLALTLFRLEQVTSRLIRMFHKGRRWLAVRLALSNPVINSYFLFTVLMFYLFIRLENRFAAQGRNWLPFMLPIFLVGLVYAPKALTLRRTRQAFAVTLTAGLLLYCCVGSYYSILTLKKRYYPERPQPAPLVQVEAHPGRS